MEIEKSSIQVSKDAGFQTPARKQNTQDPLRFNQKVTSSDLRNLIKSPDHFIFMFAVESKLI